MTVVVSVTQRTGWLCVFLVMTANNESLVFNSVCKEEMKRGKKIMAFTTGELMGGRQVIKVRVFMNQHKYRMCQYSLTTT